MELQRYVSLMSLFGAPSGPLFGALSDPLLGALSDPLFGAPSEPPTLKLFDLLVTFTLPVYQPSDNCRTLLQAQHRSRENPGAQYKGSQLHLSWRP